MFYFPCSLVSFKFLPYDLPSVFTLSSLQVCLPLSAVLFPLYVPLVIAPVGPPHLFLVLSLVFVYLVCVFPALLVCSLHLFVPDFASVCPCPMFLLMSVSNPLIVCFGFEFSMFVLYFAFFFALCFILLEVLVLVPVMKIFDTQA